MKTQKNIILTFDYELFFSKSGTAEKSIICPTNQLLDTLIESEVCATFFVDTTYLNKLRSSQDSSDHRLFDKIVLQLQQIVKIGSRIELHLHPHWIDAIKNGDSWIFPNYEHYKLKTLSKEKIANLFSDGCQLLNQIARNIDPQYKVEVFRAGGWCIEPISILKETFLKNDIRIDSSVCPGLYLNGKIHHVDYRDIPLCAIYRFEDNVREKNSNGTMTEIPVNGYYMSGYERFIWVLKSKVFRHKSQIWGDGCGMVSVQQHSKLNKFLQMLHNERLFLQFSFDGYIDKNTLYRKVCSSELPFITFIAHPKTLTISSLDAIRYFKTKGFDFYTIKDIANGNW